MVEGIGGIEEIIIDATGDPAFGEDMILGGVEFGEGEAHPGEPAEEEENNGSGGEHNGSEPGPPPPPPPPAVVLPPPPPPPAGAARPARIGEAWGPFWIAPVNVKGVHVAWGVTCGRHHSGGQDAECKRQRHGTSLDLKCQMMEWLLRGHAIPEKAAMGKDRHYAIEPRDLPVRPVAELVAARIRLFGY